MIIIIAFQCCTNMHTYFIFILVLFYFSGSYYLHILKIQRYLQSGFSVCQTHRIDVCVCVRTHISDVQLVVQNESDYSCGSSRHLLLQILQPLCNFLTLRRQLMKHCPLEDTERISITKFMLMRPWVWVCFHMVLSNYTVLTFLNVIYC